MSLAEQVIALIDESAGTEGFHRVRKVVREVGAFATVVDGDQLSELFEEVRRVGAELRQQVADNIDRMPGRSILMDKLLRPAAGRTTTTGTI